jgi:hypothetical protein
LNLQHAAIKVGDLHTGINIFFHISPMKVESPESGVGRQTLIFPMKSRKVGVFS